VNNAEVDIVYVGNIHAFRRQTGEMCLLANKHVLLEKPFACNTSDAEYLMALAKERNLFLMEVRTFRHVHQYLIDLQYKN
jgi:predicted dehydrogenase